MLPFAHHGASESEAVAIFLAVLLGGIFLIFSVAVLLRWAGSSRREPRLPRVTPLDDKVGEMWKRQVQMPRPFYPYHRHAA